MAEDPHPPTSFIAPSIEELTPLFPNYRIEAFIAQGGMGAVYKATQKSLDRTVALKILPREFGNDAKFRASFEAEAKAMARLNHPNLISVYDFGKVDGMLFIMMEYVKGKALYYSIHKKAIEPKIALNLISKISRGLGHAHKGGILHRDIKPANILLDIDAEPKVGDFGLARPMDAKRGEGLAFGTPGYTAPEVYTNADVPIDQRSDIFSVGAMLFELVKGRAPKPGATNMSTGLDPRLDELLRKATHADPNKRFNDVTELADRLDALAPTLKAASPGTTGPVTASLPSPRLLAGLQGKKLPTAGLLASAALVIAGLYLVFPFKTDHKTPPLLETAAIPAAEKTQEDPAIKVAPIVNTPPPAEPATLAQVDKPKATPPPTPLPKPKPEPKPVIEPEPEPEKIAVNESPLDSLRRLKSDLHVGNFTELPIGTVRTDRAAYFLYEPRLSWAEAHAMADSFGASLATAKTTEQLAFLRDSLQLRSTVWIGASDSGIEGKWYWVDGSSVDPKLWTRGTAADDPRSLSAKEDFAGLSAHSLQGFTGVSPRSAIFEWRLDRSRAAALEAQLTRTAATLLEKGTPIFPAPAFEFGGSRYLIIEKKATHAEATQLAENAGGHLAVLSSPEESEFLTSLLSNKFKDGNDCWFGSRRPSAGSLPWETSTGEIFAFHQWITETDEANPHPETALRFTRNNRMTNGFIGDKAQSKCSHILIEWSHPSLRNMPSEIIVKTSTLETLEKIRADLRENHSRDYLRYSKKRTRIISNWVESATEKVSDDRDLTENNKAAILAQLRAYDQAHALPEMLPAAAPTKILRSFRAARENLAELWADYHEDWEGAKSEYREALTEAGADALRETEATFKSTIAQEIALTQNDLRFRKILEGVKSVGLPK